MRKIWSVLSQASCAWFRYADSFASSVSKRAIFLERRSNEEEEEEEEEEEALIISSSFTSFFFFFFFFAVMMLSSLWSPKVFRFGVGF